MVFRILFINGEDNVYNANTMVEVGVSYVLCDMKGFAKYTFPIQNVISITRSEN